MKHRIFLNLFMVLGAMGISAPVYAGQATAIFAAGCFWCIEKDMEHVEGVSTVVSGYTGGRTDNPTYKQVSHGGTGHYEAVQVTYDPDVVSYKQLLRVFWNNVDPYDAKGQYCDKGESYRAAIFYGNEEEKAAALASKQALESSGQLNGKIVTGIIEAAPFYDAEDYHQGYYEKSPWKYKFYRKSCGRDQRIKKVWGNVNLDEILK